MVDEFTALAVRQLATMGDDKRIVILHPHFVYHHAVLAEVLHESRVVYVRACDTWAQLEDAVSAAREAVDQQLDAPLNGEGLRWFVLDEFDRLPSAIVAPLVHQLLKLVGRGRVMLIGREMPHLMLQDPVLCQRAVFLPQDSEQMLLNYAQHSNNAVLEVHSFGKGQVILNGRHIENWDGVLPRLLFFYLADRGMATRGDIFNTFWPQLTNREATNVFHVTKRKINEIFGLDFTVYWSGYYRISPEIQLHYDAIRFTQLCQNGEIAPPLEAELLLTQAVNLYRGDFLASSHSPWVEQRRWELKQTYSDALCTLAKLKTDKGLMREGLGLYLRALSIDAREDIIVNVMQLYSELGQPQEALEAYQWYERKTAALQITPQVSAIADVLRDQTA